MNYKISVLLVLSALLVVSCSTIAPVPTPTPMATLIPVDAFTLEPISTLSSTFTEIPVTDLLALPTGTPVKQWKGIPIMPGALTGDGNDEQYSFTTKSSVAEVQAYYEKELTALGWELMTQGVNSTDEVLLIFNNQKPPLIPITIIRQGDVTFVMIVSSQ